MPAGEKPRALTCCLPVCSLPNRSLVWQVGHMDGRRGRGHRCALDAQSRRGRGARRALHREDRLCCAVLRNFQEISMEI